MKVFALFAVFLAVTVAIPVDEKPKNTTASDGKGRGGTIHIGDGKDSATVYIAGSGKVIYSSGPDGSEEGPIIVIVNAATSLATPIHVLKSRRNWLSVRAGICEKQLRELEKIIKSGEDSEEDSEDDNSVEALKTTCVFLKEKLTETDRLISQKRPEQNEFPRDSDTDKKDSKSGQGADEGKAEKS